MNVLKLILILQVLVHQTAFCQQSLPMEGLQVNPMMTTHLIFDRPILSVDLGSKDLLAKRAGGVQNILQVKASRDSIEPTNLTVITQDGKLHSFYVVYAAFPENINILVGDTLRNPVSAMLTGIPHGELAKAINWVKNTELKPLSIQKQYGAIRMGLDGIFFAQDQLFFRLRLYNDSDVPLDIERLRFFLADRKAPKRISLQQVELNAEFIDGNAGRIEPRVLQSLVLVLPKFALPKGKYFSLEIREQQAVSAGRNLSLRVKGSQLLKACAIPILH